MAENSADSLPAKRESPIDSTHSSPSKSPNPGSAPEQVVEKSAKKAAREAKKQEKQAKKQEKQQKKDLKKSKKLETDPSASKDAKSPHSSQESDAPSPKIKSQSMMDEEDDDYYPEDSDSHESELSLLSEEKDHGDIDNFDIEEYKKFLASHKDEDL